ncbi:hypothetical protein MBM_06340 [Drepanopeziza brunnea f. sp. 'multigermtubi' MB_m1]|uniref:Uncharacterized protein n=1 Tax=Marssonina brunnea f. sp. multigermtubi (strain MB_m1) TaxID=1072389 RepID=K1WTG0_MARBU|nr:uncharacterized protein MBM_06340 [Drepanopeziza brunnea f. sp. 'multigermtubi' MB_m1]EKD15712.1 hypothetical protein MBM_06340 [Drepanopeziza brunnea f. sp. 'multigermtubi' MB_m1]
MRLFLGLAVLAGLAIPRPTDVEKKKVSPASLLRSEDAAAADMARRGPPSTSQPKPAVRDSRELRVWLLTMIWGAVPISPQRMRVQLPVQLGGELGISGAYYHPQHDPFRSKILLFVGPFFPLGATSHARLEILQFP